MEFPQGFQFIEQYSIVYLVQGHLQSNVELTEEVIERVIQASWDSISIQAHTAEES
ncbi:hypothetical protein [Paenibacillus monticola]|uniref:Uncharacterized protein n=1 Tax=Paenibacillus monticola TaxID=2666075 RepID=A0A7X2L365_9BACL|nr:hypothetical protein [Paenibacillus monticola]MRN55134.1 hypothetical protein [Paenibacillus monticola]